MLFLILMRAHDLPGLPYNPEKMADVPQRFYVTGFACVDRFDRHPTQFVSQTYTTRDYLNLKLKVGLTA